MKNQQIFWMDKWSVIYFHESFLKVVRLRFLTCMRSGAKRVRASGRMALENDGRHEMQVIHIIPLDAFFLGREPQHREQV